MVTSETIETKQVCISISASLWEKFDSVTSRKSTTRTEVILKYVRNFIANNEGLLFPVNPKDIVIDKQVEKERSHILNTFHNQPDDKKKTTLVVPVDLWNDFFIVVRKRLGRHVKINNIIVTIATDFVNANTK